MPLQNRMFAIGRSMGISEDDAADIVQETLVRLWRARAGIPSAESELIGYCLAAFRNECVSAFRRKRQKIPLDEAAEVEGDGCGGDEFEFRNEKSLIYKLIETLPPSQRTAIKLSGISGFENAEIAELTGQTESNVRQLLSRARRKLRKMWSDME